MKREKLHSMTLRDIEIYNFIEEFGSINTKQAAKIFFQTKENGTPISQKRLRATQRLKKIAENNKLKVLLSGSKMQNFYIRKPPTQHRIKLIDLYAELVDRGAKILEFNREVKLENVYPDALVVFEINGIKRAWFVEIDIYNSTNPAKYLPLYKTNEMQRIYGVFPAVVIISPQIVKTRKDNELPYKIFRFDYNMDISPLLQ